MPKYTCDRCLKEFSQKSHYDKHENKKHPCQDNKGKIEEVVENIIINKNLNLNSDKIKTNCLDTMTLTNGKITDINNLQKMNITNLILLCKKTNINEYFDQESLMIYAK